MYNDRKSEHKAIQNETNEIIHPDSPALGIQDSLFHQPL